MLKLDLSNEPTWLDLGHGVRVRLRPLTTALMVAARGDPTVQALDENASDEESALAFARALAKVAILDWEGVGDAEDNPIPISPEAIDALLDLWPLFETFQTGYVAKGLLLEQEKNASAPLPNGSSAGARDTAKPATLARAPQPSAKTARKG